MPKNHGALRLKLLLSQPTKNKDNPNDRRAGIRPRYMKQILAGLRRDQLQKIADDTRNDRRRVAQIVHKMVVDVLAMNSYEQTPTVANNLPAHVVRPSNSKGFPKMTKTSITATFANGETITRKTTMKLTHAWRAFGCDSKGNQYVRTGFSGSAEKARKAANAELRYMTHNPSGSEVVEVVATAPAKKVNPAKSAPWRIAETTTGGSKRFVKGNRGEHLRFTTEAEAKLKALEIQAAHDERCSRMSSLVPCLYWVTNTTKKL